MSFLQHILILFILILINSISISTTSIELTTIVPLHEQIAGEILKIQNDLKRDEEQLRIDWEKLKIEKQSQNKIDNTDVLRLNVGGEIMMTTRETLTRIPKSIFSVIFNGRWEHKLQIDENGNLFFDFNPIIFRHLLDQLQLFDKNNLNNISPPSDPSFVAPFKKMLRKLDLHHLLSSEKNIITFNVDGQFIRNQRTIFNQISNSTFDTIVSSSKTTNLDDKSDVFVDYNPKLFRHLINQLRDESLKSRSYFEAPSDREKISFEKMLNDLSIYLSCATASILIVYRPNNYFSAQNPDGYWSYGFVKPDHHLSFQRYTKYVPNAYGVPEITNLATHQPMSGTAIWYSSDLPYVKRGTIAHNTNRQTSVQYMNEFILRPDQLAIHPGENGEHGCIRFTVPSTGLYNIQGVFFSPGLPSNLGGSATTSAHLSINNIEHRSLWINKNSGFLSVNQIYLNVGDYVQFEVGYGQNNNYYYDTTAVNITITAYV